MLLLQVEKGHAVTSVARVIVSSLTTVFSHSKLVMRATKKKCQDHCRSHVCVRRKSDGSVVNYTFAPNKPVGSRVESSRNRGTVMHRWADMLPVDS